MSKILQDEKEKQIYYDAVFARLKMFWFFILNAFKIWASYI